MDITIPNGSLMDNAIIKEEKNNVCILTLNRPDKRNALNREILMRLGDAINESASTGVCKVMIIKGADERAFCAGGDLTELKRGAFSQFVKAIEYFQESLVNYPFPAIAMIRGAVIGLGLDMATMCDIRLAGDDAYFSANMVRLGKVYHHTSTERLINIVGWGAATEMLLTGCTIDAKRAEKIGLVNQVYPAGLLDKKVHELTMDIERDTVAEAVRDTKYMLRRLMQNGIIGKANET